MEVIQNLKNFLIPKEEVLEKKEIVVKTDLKTFDNWGYEKAGLVKGDAEAFVPALQAIKIQCEEEQRKDEVFQKQERLKVEQEIESIKGEINNLQADKDSKESELKIEGDKIDSNKNEIEEIKKHPEKILGKDQDPSKLSLIIGVIIIAFLTIYLFVFYSSASYSAFFKEFDVNSGTGLVDKILDAQTLSKAWNDGITELIFICTIPFVFLGLGFLIHKFNQATEKIKYIKIAMLFIVTFVFDTILAYTITKKIYDLNAENSFEVLDPYNLSMAFQSASFWAIIFAGFIVYVIWGFVFDFVMDEYYKLDKVGVHIKELEEKIKEYKQKCKELKEKILELSKQINTKNALKESKEKELNYMTVINKDLVALELSNFTVGWLRYMSGAGISKDLRDNVRTQSDNFISQYKSTSLNN